MPTTSTPTNPIGAPRPTRNETTMTYETTTALHVVNGDTVLIGGQYRTVHSAHYCGPIDGSGTTTLVFADRESVIGADQPVRRVAR